ncbi:hypothetical protein A3C96_03560 [Candidatus Uhrbacteria bacterium RIFCSPHIGHO2_02_FULL_60_10]|uniref:Probable nicotinate-nucleotide adenylyltransferase n=1 Tax=Candidatus Uhrbacteria bacterium RIFCSPHIGHO2_02_FULL_60_10 TaxID=1802392 RepID=A0A1F7U3P1_9BACT|nr:MAG: hypothetical protein A3C96_03560 [Candidatus Uhrbacteria bacterium RIFCSPHIGHO2_02_FULL_60_10]
MKRQNGMMVDELMNEIKAVFARHFGVTTDAERMSDIATQFFGFRRALTRAGREAEFGDLLAALLVFAKEQRIDPVEAVRRTLAKIERRADIYAQRGDRPKVAIFGGSFDPPHLGHIAVARALLRSKAAEQVWFMPAYGYIGSKRLMPARHRAAMCRLLEALDPRFKYFGYEIDHRLSSETLQTMLKLSEEEVADRNRLHFVVSVETANDLSNWSRSDELMRAVPFIVVPRAGYEPDFRNPWFLQEPHVYLAAAKDLLGISSTAVRNAYRAGDFAKAAALVPPSIDRYIRRNRLYGAKPSKKPTKSER